MHATYYFLVTDIEADATEAEQAKAAETQIEHFAAQNFDENNWWDLGILVAKERVILLPSQNSESGWQEFVDSIKAGHEPQTFITHMLHSALVAFAMDAEVAGTNPYGIRNEANEHAYKKLETMPTNELVSLIELDCAERLAQAYTLEAAKRRASQKSETWDLESWNRKNLARYYELFKQSDFKPFTSREFDPYRYRFFDIRGAESGDPNFNDELHGIVLADVHT